MHGLYTRGYYPPPPPPPDKDDYRRYLTKAIKADSLKDARKVFDEAFYDKIELKPDWYQLLCAVASGNAEMVRLLATHGATWTKEEAAALKQIYPDENNWRVLEWALKRGGIREDYSALPAPDIATRLALAQRIFAEEKDERALKETDKALSDEIINALSGGDTEKAVELLRLRQPEGEEALDINPEISRLLASPSYDQKIKKALETLPRSRPSMPFRKFRMGAEDYCNCPEAVHVLYDRSLLDLEQPKRINFISAWTDHKAEWKRYRGAASILFGKHVPLSETEADAFITFALSQPKGQLDDICAFLRDSTGFFSGPAWTQERLELLSEKCGAGSELQLEFNKKIAGDRFGGMTAEELLKKPDFLAAFAEAHRRGHYHAPEKQVTGLIYALRDKYKNGDIPPAIEDALRAMKKGGAHFNAFFFVLDGKNSYLGRKEPGLAKILLEIGVLPPDHFELSFLRKKAGLTDKNHSMEYQLERKKGGYVDFYCQVLLEKRFPDEFIPQRGKISSYKAELTRKIYETENGLGRQMAEERFANCGGRKELLEVFNELADAHRNRGYAASSVVTGNLVYALAEKYQNARVPEDVKEKLRAMQEAGADFGSFKVGDDFLGQKEPGLAKVLLDLGILKAENFDFGNLCGKVNVYLSGDPSDDTSLTFTLPTGTKNQAWEEFFCQVYLEKNFPDEFIPMRGRPEISYPDGIGIIVKRGTTYRELFERKKFELTGASSYDFIGTKKKPAKPPRNPSFRSTQ